MQSAKNYHALGFSKLSYFWYYLSVRFEICYHVTQYNLPYVIWREYESFQVSFNVLSPNNLWKASISDCSYLSIYLHLSFPLFLTLFILKYLFQSVHINTSIIVCSYQSIYLSLSICFILRFLCIKRLWKIRPTHIVFLSFRYANSDGTNRHVVIQGDIPHAYSITVFEDWIYWTDLSRSSIEKANKYTGANRVVMKNTTHHPFDICVIHPLRQKSRKDIYIYFYTVLFSLFFCILHTGWNNKIVTLEKTTWFHFCLMKTGFPFFVADHLLVGQLCTNPKSNRNLLSCLKVTQCSLSEIGDALLYNSSSLPIQVMTTGLWPTPSKGKFGLPQITGTCPGWWKQSFRLQLWSLVWFQVRATSCHLTSSKSAWKSTPKYAWMC